ncbi:MAG: hypothetical protein R2940_04535 [Syntrophotaleaceae bacterium]
MGTVISTASTTSEVTVIYDDMTTSAKTLIVIRTFVAGTTLIARTILGVDMTFDTIFDDTIHEDVFCMSVAARGRGSGAIHGDFIGKLYSL